MTAAAATSNPWLTAMYPPVPPDAVAIWPLAPGWWCLAALLAMLAGYRIWRRWRQWRLDRYRRLARAELRLLEADFHRPGKRLAALRRLPVLLREVALRTAPREQLVPLSGEDWWRWLDAATGGDAFVAWAGRQLHLLAFAPDARLLACAEREERALLAEVDRWICDHRPAERR